MKRRFELLVRTYKEEIKFGVQLVIIIATVVISVIFGIHWTQTFPLSDGGEYYELKVTYLEGRTIENISAPDTLLEGLVVSVRFEVNESKIYKVIQGHTSEGVVKEFAYVTTICNSSSEIFWFTFREEGFIALAEVVGPFPDIFGDMIAIGVLQIKST